MPFSAYNGGPLPTATGSSRLVLHTDHEIKELKRRQTRCLAEIFIRFGLGKTKIKRARQIYRIHAGQLPPLAEGGPIRRRPAALPSLPALPRCALLSCEPGNLEGGGAGPRVR